MRKKNICEVAVTAKMEAQNEKKNKKINQALLRKKEEKK